jgi:hypothetical protein
LLSAQQAVLSTETLSSRTFPIRRYCLCPWGPPQVLLDELVYQMSSNAPEQGVAYLRQGLRQGAFKEVQPPPVEKRQGPWWSSTRRRMRAQDRRDMLYCLG